MEHAESSENQLSNYTLSSSDGNFSYMNVVGHNARTFSGWDLGESISNASLYLKCVIKKII